MLIIPAIDIKDGKCVRLLQGNPNKATVYPNEPVEQAKLFESLGAKLIHVIDLDGVFAGRVINRSLIGEIAAAVSVPIEVGGGIRTKEDIKTYLNMGIKRIILGSSILSDDFTKLIEDDMDNIIAGIDTKDGLVAVKGWNDISSVSLNDALQRVMSFGINEIIHTDISSDGMLRGPKFNEYRDILTAFPNIRLIASGGVSSMEDLQKLYDIGVYGVITGKSIYDGKIDLERALEEF